jgi:hypothetical protein
MSNAVFPYPQVHLTFTWLKTMKWSTIVQTASNEVELRIAQTQNPIWKYTLVYDFIKDYLTPASYFSPYTDLAALMGFYAARQGQFDSFLFRDPDDNSVGPALNPDSSPNLGAQLQVVNDGVGHYYSPIQRNLGGLFYEDVTDLNGPIEVCANGALQALGTNYTIGGPGLSIPGYSFMGMYIAWASAPANPVTAQFNFYYRLRFDTDSQDFEKFLNKMWTIGGSEGKNGSGYLKLITARPLV